MGRTRIVSASLSLIAALAVSGGVAVSASAKSTLTLVTAKGPLATGEWPGGARIEGAGSLVFAGKSGSFECSTSSIEGNLRSNGGKDDLEELVYEGVRAEGGGGLGECASTVPGDSSAELDFYGDYLATEFKTSGKGAIVPYEDSQIIRLDVYLPGGGCDYESHKVAVKFTPGTAGHPAPVVLAISKQTFKLEGTTGVACQKSLKLSGDLALSSEGETLESEL
jgi:hypothetical protein